MGIFFHLGKIRAFERAHLPFLKTIEDFEIVRVIGLYQERGEMLLLKQLHLEGAGSFATVSRRLGILRRDGHVLSNSTEADRRAIVLTLNPQLQRLYQRYGNLLATQGI
jgi:DNA-binding MarR family transcriptional regulator